MGLPHSTKSFEFWLDGQCLVISQVHFDKKESLQKQLEHTILSFDSWEEDIRHKYVNTLKSYIEEEKQLFISKEFVTFVIRYDQLFGISTFAPFPTLFRYFTIESNIWNYAATC